MIGWSRVNIINAYLYYLGMQMKEFMIQTILQNSYPSQIGLCDNKM